MDTCQQGQMLPSTKLHDSQCHTHTNAHFSPTFLPIRCSPLMAPSLCCSRQTLLLRLASAAQSSFSYFQTQLFPLKQNTQSFLSTSSPYNCVFLHEKEGFLHCTGLRIHFVYYGVTTLNDSVEVDLWNKFVYD